MPAESFPPGRRSGDPNSPGRASTWRVDQTRPNSAPVPESMAQPSAVTPASRLRPTHCAIGGRRSESCKEHRFQGTHTARRGSRPARDGKRRKSARLRFKHLARKYARKDQSGGFQNHPHRRKPCPARGVVVRRRPSGATFPAEYIRRAARPVRDRLTRCVTQAPRRPTRRPTQTDSVGVAVNDSPGQLAERRRRSTSRHAPRRPQFNWTMSWRT